MKEYAFETSKVDTSRLRSDPLFVSDYSSAHGGTVIVTHDAFIGYNGGIVLARRRDNPCKGQLFPIGGRVKRGVGLEHSLRLKAFEECGLDLRSFDYLDVVRLYCETDPCGHNKGTDIVNFVYFSRGEGDLKLDDSIEYPIIVTPLKYKEG